MRCLRCGRTLALASLCSCGFELVTSKVRLLVPLSHEQENEILSLLPPQRVLLIRAEKGDISAQMTLASMYLEGKDVPTSKTAAIKWYTIAAGQGNQIGRAHV